MTLLSELVPVVRTIDDSVDDTEALGFLQEKNDTHELGGTNRLNHRHSKRIRGLC
jgi:hypothetical protein